MNPLQRLTTTIEEAEGLDRFAAKFASVAAPLGRPSVVRDALTGRWLGHSVHPMLVAIPIGGWIGAAALDVTGASSAAIRRLVAIGTLAALPTAATGTADWIDTAGAERRVGFVHAALNDVAVALFAGSWLSRRSERVVLARVLSTAGLGAMSVAGFLGGHLAYVRGVGVNTTAFQAGPVEWTRVAQDSDVALGGATAAELDGVSLLLVRRDDRIDVLEDRCTHRGAPLSQGEVNGECIVCPWHGSRFTTRDGLVMAGPASVAQPAYESRVTDGWIEIRRPESGDLRLNPV